jgi:hypothetical protein
LLHIDFHGKFPKYPKDDKSLWGDIDVGAMSMNAYFVRGDAEIITEPMKESFKKSIDKMYKGKPIQLGVQPKAELDPYLHGFWGDDLHTMTS